VARFEPGKSGNAKGYPKGRPHRLTTVARKLVEEFAPELVRQVLTEATAERDSIRRREARQLAFRFLLPRFSRFIAERFAFVAPTNLVETKQKLGELAQAFTEGKIDVDAFSALVAALRAIDGAEREAVMERLAEIDRALGGGQETGSGALSA
jgi:hypothetical protein